MADKREILMKLRDELKQINPNPWNNVEKWEAKAKTFIKQITPENLAEFEKYCHPSHVMFAYRDRLTGRSHVSQIDYTEDKEKLINFFEGLIEVNKVNDVPQAEHIKEEHSLRNLHPEISSKCKSLFANKEYAECVGKSFRVVKDRLRDLTGYESGSEAFGKSRIHIKGAAASNVDDNFNQAVKFLTMAIDQFRNEKHHTSDAHISDPNRAYEYLALSSLAMHLLDNAEILP